MSVFSKPVSSWLSLLYKTKALDYGVFLLTLILSAQLLDPDILPISEDILLLQPKKGSVAQLD